MKVSYSISPTLSESNSLTIDFSNGFDGLNPNCFNTFLKSLVLTIPSPSWSYRSNCFSRLKNGKNLNDILPEAFALVREASKRINNERHFDVQLIGGIALHENKIAEMKTGEGKTLTIVLSAYLNALEKKGVHVVTVNDYLAKRDSQNMGKIYNFLGLDCGYINTGQTDEERKNNYSIT